MRAPDSHTTSHKPNRPLTDEIGPPDYQFEAAYQGKGYVIGIDEAGRGPWAGPVCAAAFWLHPDKLAHLPTGLNDSKKITAKKRTLIEAALYEGKGRGVFDFEAAIASVAEIDALGILQANFKAMGRATSNLAARLLAGDPLGLRAEGRCEIAAVLVDGNLLPPKEYLAYRAQAFIKGDGRVLSIAAASIIAKQHRDGLMAELHQAHPHYGWDKNQGYGTKAHQEGLDEFGITDHHRTSFAPIKKRLS